MDEKDLDSWGNFETSEVDPSEDHTVQQSGMVLDTKAGTVTISLEKATSYVALTLTDSGCSISQRFSQKEAFLAIFMAFLQGTYHVAKAAHDATMTAFITSCVSMLADLNPEVFADFKTEASPSSPSPEGDSDDEKTRH